MKPFFLSLLMAVLLQNGVLGFDFSKAGYWDVPGSPRTTSSFNAGWEFSLDNFRTAKAVNLPHGIDEGEISYESSGGVNRQCGAWYRKRFAFTKRTARQFLHFEAIMGKSRVTVNGRPVAEHFGGYLPIHVEVTDVLTNGVNTVEVWCDNSDDDSYPPGKKQNVLDFTYFGGIYRDAWFIETGDAYVADTDHGGVYVTTTLEKDGTWTVRADVALGGATDGAVAELLYDGQPVVSPFKPANPALWTPDTPNLHLLTVNVKKGGACVDAVGVKFGVRDFVLDENGLTLNGKPFRKLIGVNRHQDYLFIGNALPNSLHWRDAKKYRDAGLTIIRNAHYPQDPAFMDACDALGLFVIIPTPGWQFWNDRNPKFGERVYDDIVKMVRRDRGRASCFMWEPILNETHFPEDFALKARDLVKRETRAPNYCACDGSSKGSEAYDVNYGSSKNDPKKPLFCREWGDFPDDWNAQNSSSRVAMEWGETPMLAQAWHYMHETYWPSLQTQLAQPKRHFGGTLWHGADHARGYHPVNFLGGILTYARQKKYSWHAFKAALTEKPYVFLAHELSPYSPREFTIFSNCAYTATWLGKPFTPGETAFKYFELQRLTYDWGHPDEVKKAIFTVTLPDGTTEVRRPAKRFTQIALAADTEGLAPVADGSDLVTVTATLADTAGTAKRYAQENVLFTVEGPAELVGENPQQTRWGEAVILVRPLSGKGPVTVRAETVRKGDHVRQKGELVLKPVPPTVPAVPGILSANLPSSAGPAPARTRGGASGPIDLSGVEQQQKDFNVKRQ